MNNDSRLFLHHRSCLMNHDYNPNGHLLVVLTHRYQFYNPKDLNHINIG